MDRADFVDDPIFSIAIVDAEPEPIIAGPIGASITNDSGYRAERAWTGVEAESFRQLLVDLVDSDVTFHELFCASGRLSFSGSKTLASGLLASVKVRYLPDDTATLGLTGLEPNEDGANPFRPPSTVEVGGDCDHPELVAAAQLDR